MNSNQINPDARAVIQASMLSKTYYFYRNPLLKLWDLASKSPGRNGSAYHALDGINFAVSRGESVALVGHNGSGKSTLLKLIAGVSRPSTGQILAQGRIAALLELGTGFHGEFTGRENLLMNARMNGLNDDEIHNRMQEIIKFSELGDFIDRKVRTYSSGMLLRLGFSLATHVDAEILLVDEALSVGDAYFQSKCMRRMHELVHSEGRTLLYVSHDPSSVKLICRRALLLSKGRIIGDGAPDTVLDHYNALSAHENQLDEDALMNAYAGKGGMVSGDPRFKVLNTRLLDDSGKERVSFISGEHARLRCTFRYEGPEEIHDITMGLHIRDSKGYEVFGTNTFHTGFKVDVLRPKQDVTLAFDFPLNIGRGRYTIGLAFHSGREHTAKNYKWMDKALVFEMSDDHRYVFDGVARLNGLFLRVE
jgi:lipopolysaccharide transport system ATP-binding protein